MVEETITDEITPLSETLEAEELPDGGEELTRLRSELEALRAALEQKEAEKQKILSELEEFTRLFPHTSIKDVPERVWKNVEGGIPLSAAYALYEREEALSLGKIKEINLRNAAQSAGSAGKDAPREYFSPDEVRAMTQDEVHKNYKKIQNSMKHWR